MKEDIAKKATVAMITKKRNAAYERLRQELTAIAERQFANVQIKEMKKYEGEYIMFSNNMRGAKNYPDGFREAESWQNHLYEDFGFVPSSDIPLLKHFPCKLHEYDLDVCDEYAEDYTNAVRKYMLLYFHAVETYKLILESLNTVSTDKQLVDNFPELVIFCTIQEDNDKQLVPIEKLNRCKTLLRESRHLFMESLEAGA
ncbi:MAG: hypothetical protein LBQ73_05005 [Tannerellaceae bacterium]|jgi:hypothetical protein|nr:hypothetical protein [Tannerellaceae bacterium]